MWAGRSGGEPCRKQLNLREALTPRPFVSLDDCKYPKGTMRLRCTNSDGWHFRRVWRWNIFITVRLSGRVQWYFPFYFGAKFIVFAVKHCTEKLRTAHGSIRKSNRYIRFIRYVRRRLEKRPSRMPRELNTIMENRKLRLHVLSCHGWYAQIVCLYCVRRQNRSATNRIIERSVIYPLSVTILSNIQSAPNTISPVLQK